MSNMKGRVAKEMDAPSVIAITSGRTRLRTAAQLAMPEGNSMVGCPMIDVKTFSARVRVG